MIKSVLYECVSYSKFFALSLQNYILQSVTNGCICCRSVSLQRKDETSSTKVPYTIYDSVLVHVIINCTNEDI